MSRVGRDAAVVCGNGAATRESVEEQHIGSDGASLSKGHATLKLSSGMGVSPVAVGGPRFRVAAVLWFLPAVTDLM